VLKQAMASLNGRERELVALKFFAGLSNAEIATVIGTSESNAGTKLHRVVEKLRRSLNEAD
jgi:RNA polymerase sigma factor (sigma-70 family)